MPGGRPGGEPCGLPEGSGGAADDVTGPVCRPGYHGRVTSAPPHVAPRRAVEAEFPPPTPVRPTTIDRLRDPLPPDGRLSWAVTAAITLLAFFIRIVGLSQPKGIIFDETYYAKDAWSLLVFGFEGSWSENVNAAVAQGDASGLGAAGAFIVHPPLGKWLIASGEALFGLNSFGWRIAAVVFGSLLVAATIRLARRLSRSTLIGAIAGILLTFDGLAFTMSRIALLDIFQAAFLVLAVAAVVADRDYHRNALADLLEARGWSDLGGRFGPIVWWRPWRWVAGVLFGLACATKWNSLYVLAAFGVLSVLWDVGARRLAGGGFRSWLALVYDGIPAFVAMVVTAFVTYLASWTRWLQTSGGWGRNWGLDNPTHPWVAAFGEGFAALLKYHQEIYAFHTGEYIRAQTHSYDAHPAGWLLMLRPIGLDAVNGIQPGTDGCVGPENCIRVISGMGTPVLWWMGAVALVVAAIWWLAGRDWRFGVPVVAVLSTYVPWFTQTDRPLFFFYAITIIPFTCVALALVLGLVIGDARSPGRRNGAIAAGVAVALVVANFAYIYPVLTDALLPYSSWLSRMWLRSWI